MYQKPHALALPRYKSGQGGMEEEASLFIWYLPLFSLLFSFLFSLFFSTASLYFSLLLSLKGDK